MTNHVVSVTPDQSIEEAARLMSQNNVGALTVVENGQLRGVITDRDITLRSTAQGGNEKVKVSECMSQNGLVSGNPNMDVNEAAKIMAQHQIRRLPVVDNQQVVGMVSLGDLATENETKEAAGQALNTISTPSRPQ